jgi:hypothetical protein
MKLFVPESAHSWPTCAFPFPCCAVDHVWHVQPSQRLHSGCLLHLHCAAPLLLLLLLKYAGVISVLLLLELISAGLCARVLVVVLLLLVVLQLQRV